MQFIPAIHTYKSDIAAQNVWAILSEWLGDVDGYAYYRHPSLGSGRGIVPDFVILSESHGSLVVRVLDYTIDDIHEVNEEYLKVNGKEINSPILDLEDFKVALKYRFDQERKLRDRIQLNSLLALPNITKHGFEEKFPEIEKCYENWDTLFRIWKDGASNTFPPKSEALDGLSWRLAKSVFQSASELNRGPYRDLQSAKTLGEAIRALDRNIALLDDRQNRVAVQIPPGPQMIRGLAGTGKTVLLAMKAANIHSHFPNARILFTFNTQSLYNQAKHLISNFYRHNKGCDPDWGMLHIRHGWGGRTKNGVYSDLCARQGIAPLNFTKARFKNPRVPFRACCLEVVNCDIKPYYEYVLVDEAQDFPKEFFRLLWKLTTEPHRIYFAFDELQSLSQFDIPTPEELFGVDENGKPLVALQGEYEGPMDKLVLLNKSYRCHQNVLMLAHAIGLGIHNPRGCIQMIFDPATWDAIGYSIESQKLEPGKPFVVKRPPENSPDLIDNIYKGTQHIIRTKIFDEREEEIEWVAEQIERDVNEENVPPEKIVVISMNSRKVKKYMGMLQGYLHEKNIASVVPGLMDDSDEFAVEGRVTLSTVYRAKGNEAPVVYILSFDSLYDYVQEVGMRNRAFTSISRSKAWLSISGVGENMKGALKEIKRILRDIPYMKFTFPSEEEIARNLDPGETTRRRQEVKRARRSARDISEIDLGALTDLSPSELNALIKRLREAKRIKGVDK